MRYPELNAPAQEQLVTEAFAGYNHNLRIADGEFYEMQNLTSDYYPLLSQRAARAMVGDFSGIQGLLAKDALAWIEDGVLWYNALSMAPYMGGVLLSEGQKQMVSMGAYICVFPDGWYFNTEDYTDNGYMGHENIVDCTQTALSIKVCTVDGAVITITYRQQAMPEDAANDAYWLDTGKHELKQWSSVQSQWVSIPTVYVKLEANGIGAGFKKYDGVQISGLDGTDQVEKLNGSHVLQDVGDNYLVIVGIVDADASQSTGEVKAARRVPKMDYITESGNRLWGCRYGVSEGKTVNELYCCKLGDFKNWECYQGISTDSWRASCGTDGRFTGAATLADSPIFFKEDCFHRIYPSAQGAHQVKEIKARGVQRGSEQSLTVIADKLYYKARDGVCVYDGSLPYLISDAFGTELYRKAAAGGVRGKYFISMQDSSDAWQLFVYDTLKGLWHREDGMHATQFATLDDELYMLRADGMLVTAYGSGGGNVEQEIPWSATTGIMTCGLVGKKYISRLNLRMQLPVGSACDFWIEYDSCGEFRHAGHMDGHGLRTFLLPIRPQRCDHLRFRITGKGPFKLYSIGRVLEAGSDA
jgi:hypothetical protein